MCLVPPPQGAFKYGWDSISALWLRLPGFTGPNSQGGTVSPPNRPTSYGRPGQSQARPQQTPGQANPNRSQSTYSPPQVQGYGSATGGTQVRCTILWDPAALAYLVQIPYDPNFIEFLKAKIPGPQRAWDSDMKQWRVEDGWERVLITLATELWGAGSISFRSRAEVEQEQVQLANAQREAFMSALPPKERACFEFFELCSLDALKAAFRKMALELHPDRNNGSAEKMTRLNTAWSTLETELSKK
jgi:hypothetical protein